MAGDRLVEDNSRISQLLVDEFFDNRVTTTRPEDLRATEDTSFLGNR